MSYMCMGCYEVYDRDLGYCPKPGCYCDVVEIDELILPTIKLLNKKGFCTTYCCSGHIYGNGGNIYISFHPFLLDDFSIDEIKDMFKNLPVEWALIFNEHGGFAVEHKLDYTLRGENDVALYEEIVNANLSLFKFVQTLPNLEY